MVQDGAQWSEPMKMIGNEKSLCSNLQTYR
jgi:hypothetical protein